MQIFKRLSSLTKGQATQLLTLIVATTLLSTIFDLGTLYFFSASVKTLLGETDYFIVTESIKLTYEMLAYLTIVFVVLNITFAFFINYLNGFVSAKLNMIITNKYYEDLLSNLDIQNQRFDLNELITASTSHVTLAVNQIYMPLVNALSKSIAALLVIIFLATINLTFLLTFGSLLIATYGLILLSTRAWLISFSRMLATAYNDRVVAIKDGFAISTEVNLSGNKRYFVNKFTNLANVIVTVTAKVQLIKNSPKPIIEGVVIGGCVVALLTARNQGTVSLSSDNLGDLSVFLLAFLKIVPSMQAVFNGLAGINSSLGSLEELERLSSNIVISGKEEKIDGSLRPLISVRKLKVSFRHSHHIGPISFELGFGDVIIVRGPSGIGKSTLLTQIISGTQVQSQNKNIVVEGQIVRNSEKLNIQYVPQFPEYINDSMVANISLKGSVSKTENDKIKQLMLELNLTDIYQSSADQKVILRNLSGGQKKRLGIARAIFNEPDILIIDEPLSGLDEDNQKRVTNVLKNMAKTGTAIVMSSHHKLYIDGVKTVEVSSNDV